MKDLAAVPLRRAKLSCNSKLPSAMPVRAAPSFSEFANAHTAFKIQNSKSVSPPLSAKLIFPSKIAFGHAREGCA